MPPFEPEKIESRGIRDLIIPLLFVCFSGALLLLPETAQQQVSSVLRGSVMAPFLQVQETIHQARIRAGEIVELQAQVDSAVAQIISQRTLHEENLRLRSLLGLRDRVGPEFVAASAIRPGTRGSESMFLIDLGARDGVAVNDPVLMDGGLLGVVREVGLGTSLAMDWTHPDFRVSVMTSDGEAYGRVEPWRGAFREEDRLLLDGVAYHAVVKEGAEVVTSGQGTVYPRGIPVGTILELAGSEAGWRKSYWLEPAVHPASATHVLVLVGGGVPFSLEGLWDADADSTWSRVPLAGGDEDEPDLEGP